MCYHLPAFSTNFKAHCCFFPLVLSLGDLGARSSFCWYNPCPPGLKAKSSRECLSFLWSVILGTSDLRLLWLGYLVTIPTTNQHEQLVAQIPWRICFLTYCSSDVQVFLLPLSVECAHSSCLCWNVAVSFPNFMWALPLRLPTGLFFSFLFYNQCHLRFHRKLCLILSVKDPLDIVWFLQKQVNVEGMSTMSLVILSTQATQGIVLKTEDPLDPPGTDGLT